jgi:hypothetical protein
VTLPFLVTPDSPGWTARAHDLLPGAHLALLTSSPESGIEGRKLGLELRDTLLILKPGPTTSFVLLFRKPLAEPTLADQVAKSGTGPINIDGCRVDGASWTTRPKYTLTSKGVPGGAYGNQGARQADLRVEGEYRENTLGRWPSNLILVHAPQCRKEGTKRVRGANPPGANGGMTDYQTTYNVYGTYASKKPKPQVDADGMETVPSWSCVPGCPVPLLDGQSGEKAASKFVGPNGVKRSSTMMSAERGWNQNSMDNSAKNAPNNYGDSGGASRFYPQLASEADLLSWLTLLVSPPNTGK